MTYNYDPELVPIIQLLPDSGFDDLSTLRLGFLAMTKEANADLNVDGVHIENRHIRSSGDKPGIPIRIYTPEDLTEPTAGLVHIHGGGFAIGNLDGEHGQVLDICRDLNIVIVSIGYRLAPENPYPAGLEDCYAGLLWTAKNAPSLNIDLERIGVIGGSAGGGLAAALALLTRDRKGPKLCFQLLGFPELDDRLQTPSMIEFTDTPVWHRQNALLSWTYYLGDCYTPGADDVPYYAAPSRATVEELKGLPPAYISTMEFDPLRDEGLLYAMHLLQAGVNVEFHNFPGTFHGSVIFPHAAEAAVSIRSRQETMTALQRGLGLGKIGLVESD